MSKAPDRERSSRPTAVPERPGDQTVVSEASAPPATQESGSAGSTNGDEPTSALTRRRVLIGLAFIAVMLVGFYFLLPKLAGLNHTWGEVSHGDALWLALAAGLELLSIAGYVVFFRTVFGRAAAQDRLAREHRDSARRNRCYPTAGGGRRRGGGGHGLGAARSRHVGQDHRLPHGGELRHPVLDLSRRAGRVWLRPVDRGVSPAVGRSRSRSCPRFSAPPQLRSWQAWLSSLEISSGAWGPWRGDPGGSAGWRLGWPRLPLCSGWGSAPP